MLFAAFLAFVDFQMGKLPSAFYPTVITSKLCISVACSKCSHFFDVSMNQFFYFDAVVKSGTVEVYILLFSPPCGKLELQIPRCHVPASTWLWMKLSNPCQQSSPVSNNGIFSNCGMLSKLTLTLFEEKHDEYFWQRMQAPIFAFKIKQTIIYILSQLSFPIMHLQRLFQFASDVILQNGFINYSLNKALLHCHTFLINCLI